MCYFALSNNQMLCKVGAERIGRCAAPNDDPTFIACITDIVANHLKSGEKVSAFKIKLFNCLNDMTNGD